MDLIDRLISAIVLTGLSFLTVIWLGSVLTMVLAAIAELTSSPLH